MADPISIFGAVAAVLSVIDILSKSIGILDDLTAQWKTSDMALLSLTSQLRALSAALVKIQEWMESGIEEVHHQLVLDLNNTINCCKMLASKVYSEISDLQKAPSGSLVLTSRVKFLFRRSGMGELQSMIDRQSTALTLLLTACNSKSLAKQQEFLGKSGIRKRMDRVQKDTTSLASLVDSASFLSKRTENSSKLSMLFDFDDELFTSRPYKSIIRKTVKLSIRSSQRNSPGPEEVITSISGGPAGYASQISSRNRGIESQLTSSPQISTKILLLGAGESSKTTFLKQTQSIYGHSESVDERREWRTIIYGNLTAAFHEYIAAFDDLEIDAESSLDVSLWNRVFSMQTIIKGQSGQMVLENGLRDDLPAEFAEVFRALFHDETAQTAVRNGRISSIPDTLGYYMEHLDRICAQTYIPIYEDILHARVRTTGIEKYRFRVRSCGECCIYDVGGERSERRKWLSLYDGKPLVLFLVPMSCYDEVLYEDQHVNRMQEALMLFDSIVNDEEYLMQTRMILCFTKMDIFEEKIRSWKLPMNQYFPNYEGTPWDVHAAETYITGRFTNVLTVRNELDIVYLNATEINDVQEVLKYALEGITPESVKYFNFVKRSDSAASV